jgi:exopolyphosphatase / guanosine-5'-triphosphate,3'-diphosphate pyrophosphatase
VGIVDLGSNTARLVVFEMEPGRWFHLVDQIREPIRLGQGMGRGRRLSEEAIERAAAAMELYSEYATATGLDHLEVLATSALRDAENAEHFFARVEPLGLSIRILSGEDEARLGVSAVANGFGSNDAWVMDLGGGSAQLSRMSDGEFVRGEALPLGGLRLSEAFLASDPPRKTEVERLEAAIAAHLDPWARDLARDRGIPLVAMGGTIRNLSRAVQKATGYPLARLHGYRLPREAFEALVVDLLQRPLHQRERIPGIRADRADIIVAGALVYRWLLRASGRKGLLVSGWGVREGAFLQRFLEPPHRLEDVGRFTIQNLLQRYPQPVDHVDHVRFLAHRLFAELRPLHRLGDRDLELLDAATRLHDIGTAISYYGHHKHGAYLLASNNLPGFTHREQALILLLVRFHRSGSPRWGIYRQLADRDDDKHRLRCLTACLRLAEYLERAHAARVEDLSVEIDPGTIRLEIEASEPPTVEIAETRKHASLVRAAFGRTLELRMAFEAPERTR